MKTEREFLLFYKLPLELQINIWTFAAADPLPSPGAHFFTLFDTVADDTISLIWQTALDRTAGDDLILAAPRVEPFKRDRLSWTESNKSAYLMKRRCGLWTACKTSRMVMQSLADTTNQILSQNSVTYKITPEDRSWHLAVFPAIDLICFQPWVYWTSMMRDIDSFIGQGKAWWRGFNTPHIALEFDPTWLGMPNPVNSSNLGGLSRPGLSTILCVMKTLGFKYSSLEHLWFIDYTIRRRTDGRMLGGNARQFAGNGFSFMEVMEDDSGWDLSSTGVFHWLRRVRAAVLDSQGPTQTGQRLTFGILACEKLNS